eukprot:403362439
MAAAHRVIEEIKDYFEVVEMKIERLQKTADKLQGCKNQTEKTKLQEILQKDIDKVNNDIRNAQYDLKRLPKDKEAEFEEDLLKFKRKVDKIANQQKQLNQKSSDSKQINIEFEDEEAGRGPNSSRRKRNNKGDRKIQYQNDIELADNNFQEEDQLPEKIDYTKADVQVVGRKGLEMQDKSKKVLEGIQKKLGFIDNMADEQLLELQKQNERIMKIDTQLNTIESTSQRTMKYIRYFGKNYMTDKFIIFMVIMIAGALLGIIIAAVVKNK